MESYGNTGFICRRCNCYIKVVNNDLITALSSHNVHKIHLAACNIKENDSSRANIIHDNSTWDSNFNSKSNGTLGCKVCHISFPGRREMLVHFQQKEHENALKIRSQKLNEQKIEAAKPRNAYAMGLASIKLKSSHQYLCQLCDSSLPVAFEGESLMRNVSQHITGNNHLSKIKEMTIKLDAAREVYSTGKMLQLKEGRKEQWYFICLICNNFHIWGYDYFFQRHLSSARHVRNFEEKYNENECNVIENTECEHCHKIIHGYPISFFVHQEECQRHDRQIDNQDVIAKENVCIMKKVALTTYKNTEDELHVEQGRGRSNKTVDENDIDKSPAVAKRSNKKSKKSCIVM